MSRNFLTPIVLPAGKTTSAPLTLQSGTNLTTAAAGAIEYDGKVIYSTPASRGVSPSIMFYRLNSSLAGSNVNTAQSVFGVGVTLAANTVYAFEANYLFQKSLGSTTHIFYMLFGGTATANSILYEASYNFVSNNNASDWISSGGTIYSTTLGLVSVGSSKAGATYTIQEMIKGTISINAGGTFIPQYQLSAAPGGAYSTIAGSYFAIWPIGASGANTSVGPWA